MINTIIFDMDGVLIDLCDVHRDCFKKALKIIIGLEITDEYHDNYLNGLPSKTKLAKLNIIGDSAVKINNLKQNLTLLALENIQPDLELKSIIAGLRWSGYKIFCASNSIRKTVELVLTKLNIIDLFHGYYGNDDVFCAKPSPEIYYKCACLYGARLKQCLVIEDSLVGEETIKNSQMHGLIIKNRKNLIPSKIIERIIKINKE